MINTLKLQMSQKPVRRLESSQEFMKMLEAVQGPSENHSKGECRHIQNNHQEQMVMLQAMQGPSGNLFNDEHLHMHNMHHEADAQNAMKNSPLYAGDKEVPGLSSKVNNEKICPRCQLRIDDYFNRASCGHVFHIECFTELSKAKEKCSACAGSHN